MKLLVEDVQNALLRVSQENTEGHRREAIRTTFAAIEGVAWVFRQHIHASADDLIDVTPLHELALREKSYIVTERGELIEQTRFISLLAMIRLTTNLAEQVCPAFKGDFSHNGWNQLKRAILIRNRIVHPKTTADLSTTHEDLRTVREAFFWLLEFALNAMASVNAAQTVFNAAARELLEDLIAGDEETLAEYNRALLRLAD